MVLKKRQNDAFKKLSSKCLLPEIMSRSVTQDNPQTVLFHVGTIFFLYHCAEGSVHLLIG